MAQNSATQPLESEIKALRIVAGIMYGLAAIFLALSGMAFASLGGVNGFVSIALCGGILLTLVAFLIGKKSESYRALLPLIQEKQPLKLEVELYGCNVPAIVWLEKEPTALMRIDPTKDLVITRKGDHPLIIIDGLIKRIPGSK